MKNLNLFLSILFSCACVGLFAQSTINLSIEHYLQDQPFAFEQASQSYDRTDFDVTRLQYYISEISITDNEGNSTEFPDLWFLVDASASTDIDLGSGTMDSVRSVTFHIGVDSAHNHLDPSTWPAEHPLAHKNPSMHWGWLSGYRFNAMEGSSGENLEQAYEIHGLGDENYFSVTVETNTGVDAGNIDIQVYANYAEILREIDIESGLVSHGPIYEAQTSLENMRDFVFGPDVPESTVQESDTSGGVSIDEKTTVLGMRFFPNPAENMVYVDRNNAAQATYQVVILDPKGATIHNDLLAPKANQIDVSMLTPGVYTIVLRMTDGSGPASAVHRLIKQ